MSHETIPGWLPGRQPERLGQQNRHFITRGRLLEDSTLSHEQITALVRDGRLTAHQTLADKRKQFFDLDEVNALFEIRPIGRPGGEA
ncbi:MAG: hypothetical protein ACTHOK_02955 [Nocardioidaceae bacterium]